MVDFTEYKDKMADFSEPRLFFGKFTIDDVELRELTVDYHFQTDLESILENLLGKAENYDTVKYEYGVSLRDTYFELDVSEVDKAQILYDKLIQLPNLESINEIEDIKNFDFYVAQYQLGDKKLWGLGKTKPSWMINRSKLVFFKSDSTFTSENKGYYTLSGSFDCIITNPKITIFDSYNFESIFQFREIIVNLVNKFQPEIESTGILEGWTYAVDIIVENAHFLRKMSKIIKSKVYLDVNLDDLRVANNQYNIGVPMNGLKISIPENPSNIEMKLILKALNDDYSKSLTTPHVYSLDGSKEKLN